jgi:RecB family exonuclease
MEAIAVEALRLAKDIAGEHIVFQPSWADAGENRQRSVARNENDELIMVEIPVQSQDGLLAGRIDYAERLPHGGIRLLDYKSALRDDLPERYERQLQIYALLWYETFGEWPTEALVIYPFTGTAHKVVVDPAICQQVGQEARLIVEKLQEDLHAEQLASPGTVCTVCEFRPWCKPFWRWQAGHAIYSQALEKAVYGFEGTIMTLELKGQHWR